MLISIALATIISLFILTQRNKRVSQSVFSAPLPTVIAAPVSTMDSPEGNKTLMLQSKQDGEHATYSAFVSSHRPDDQIQQTQILNKETSRTESLTIPFNTWSPDTAYLFLVEQAPTSTDYLVFTSSGEPFSDGSPYLSVQELFTHTVPGYVIEDVTGWASPTLLIVNTISREEKNRRVSFWLDVPSRSFIQLETYFK